MTAHVDHGSYVCPVISTEYQSRGIPFYACPSRTRHVVLVDTLLQCGLLSHLQRMVP